MVLRASLTYITICISKRYAGHSKWANIKHTKALQDTQRSLLFQRLCQRMRVAIQDGGSFDPSSNIQLAQIIQVAKKQSMPTASIENCINTFKKEKTQGKNIWLEIKGPRGCFLIVSAFTYNPRKFRETISSILKKNYATFVEGSAKAIFDKKGEVHVTPPPNVSNIDALAVDHAIECGAEEVYPPTTDSDVYIFICEPQNLLQISGKLQSLNYALKSADINFIPKIRVELSDDDMDKVSRLHDKLEELPEVVRIFDNIA